MPYQSYLRRTARAVYLALAATIFINVSAQAELSAYCEGVRLEYSSGPAGAMPQVVSNSTDWRYAEVTGNGEPVVATVDRQDGLDYLVVPLHPDNGIQGGTVQVALVTDAGSCEPLQFVIEPWEVKAGAYNEAMNKLELVLYNQLSDLGHDKTVFEAGPVADHLLPLALVYDLAFNPDNPNNLRRIADGTAPALGGEVPAPELLDAAIVQSGVLAVLTAQLDLDVSLSATRRPTPPIAEPGVFLAQAGTGASDSGAAHCVDIPRNAPEVLDMYMQKQRFWRSLNSGQTKTVWDGAAGAGILVGGGAGFAIGVTVYTAQTMADLNGARYPSSVSNLLFDNSKNVFLEDEPDLTASYQNVTIDATGETFRATKVLIDGFLTLTGAKALQAAENASKGAAQFYKVADRVGQASYVAGSGVICDNNCGIDDAIERVNLAPCSWSKVDISATGFHDAKVIPQPQIVIKVDAAERSYEAISTGASALRISLPDGKFGFRSLWHDLTVTVKKMSIGVSPTLSEARPGDVVSFSATISNAYTDEVSWVATDSSGAIIAGDMGSTSQRFSFVAPEPLNGCRDNVYITVSSLSETGLRAYVGAEDVRADATLRVAEEDCEAFLEPSITCLEPGQSQQFSFVKDARWTADRGAIDETGLYTASENDRGEKVTIIAAHPVTGSEGLTTFNVGCGCSYTLKIGNSILHRGQSIGLMSGVLETISADSMDAGAFLDAIKEQAASPDTTSTDNADNALRQMFKNSPSLLDTIISDPVAMAQAALDAQVYPQLIGNTVDVWLSFSLSMNEEYVVNERAQLELFNDNGASVQGRMSGTMRHLIMVDGQPKRVSGEEALPFSLEFIAAKGPSSVCSLLASSPEAVRGANEIMEGIFQPFGSP